MRFTRLRLNGFKSFVDPTDLVIHEGLTGVVGPNGCGKSNLLEALRWVMGENRPTAMRGGEMEDVIFAGAATRLLREVLLDHHVGTPVAVDVATEEPYADRLKHLRDVAGDRTKAVYPQLCENLDQFQRFEELCLEDEYEGVMVRSIGGPYKFGRSTPTEGYLWKYKRFDDGEAIVIGVEEGTTNLNPIERDAFGHARRPGGKSNHLPTDTLGGLLCRDIETGVEFSCGSGWPLAVRKQLWEQRESLLGRVFTYRCQRVGVKEKPRFPRFVAWRE